MRYHSPKKNSFNCAQCTLSSLNYLTSVNNPSFSHFHSRALADQSLKLQQPQPDTEEVYSEHLLLPLAKARPGSFPSTVTRILRACEQVCKTQLLNISCDAKIRLRQSLSQRRESETNHFTSTWPSEEKNSVTEEHVMWYRMLRTGGSRGDSRPKGEGS